MDKTVDSKNGKYFYQCMRSLGKKVDYLTYKDDWH